MIPKPQKRKKLKRSHKALKGEVNAYPFTFVLPKPTNKKKLKRSHKALTREARGLLHDIVCKGGRCQRCGRMSGLQTSHILPKGTYRGWLQYEPLNCLCLCFQCHKNFWHSDPVASAEWFRLCFPQRYVWLQEHKSVVAKADLNKIILELKEMLDAK